MSSARLLSALAIVSTIVACSGGPGVPAPIPGSTRESPGTSGTPESPGKGSGQEPAPGGTESPGPNGPNGGSSSGGSSSGSSSSGSSSGSSSSGGSGGGNCPKCDQSYTCTSAPVAGIAGASTTETLATQNGACVVTTAGNAVFSCAGTITSGTTTLTWTATTGGGFSFVENGVTVQCTPVAESTPVSAGSGTPSGS